MLDPALLVTTIAFFPFWLPIWQNAPLTQEELNIPFRQSIREGDLQSIARILPIADSDTRAAIYTVLGSAPIPANYAQLLKCLELEQTPTLQATILRMLSHHAINAIRPEMIAPWLQSKSTLVAEAAISLYAKLPEAQAAPLLPLAIGSEAEKHPQLQRCALRALASLQKPERTLMIDRLSWLTASPETQAAALSLALSQQPRNAETDNWLDKGSQPQAHPLLRLAVAQDRHATRPEIIRRLLNDPLTGVRIAVLENANNVALRDTLALGLDDAQPAVRLAAIAALGRFSDPLPEPLLNRLVALLGDDLDILNEQASATLLAVAQSNREATIAAISRELKQDSPARQRFHSATLLRKLEARQSVSIIASIAETEQEPVNLAAEFSALARLAQPGTYGELATSGASHQSPLVRQAAAQMLGFLRLSNAEPLLRKLSKDKDPDVRATAYEAMGHHPLPSFAADLLACLKDTRRTTDAMRANAAWAAGQLRPTSPEMLQRQFLPLATRLQQHCCKPLIPMEGMLSFDSETVIFNALCSLTIWSKELHSETISNLADQAILLFNHSPNDLEGLKPLIGNKEPPPLSEASWSLAKELRAFLDGTTIQPSTVPSSHLSFPVQEL